MNLWNRTQLLKVHYQMGALTKREFVHILGEYFKEAVKLRGRNQ